MVVKLRRVSSATRQILGRVLEIRWRCSPGGASRCGSSNTSAGSKPEEQSGRGTVVRGQEGKASEKCWRSQLSHEETLQRNKKGKHIPGKENVLH